MIDAIRFVDIEAELRARRGRFELPANPSSTVRGGIGHVLREIECHQPPDFPCTDCGARSSCLYDALFGEEEGARGDGGRYVGFTRPYVLCADPPDGGLLTVKLRMFGHSIARLPNLLTALAVLQEQGIGPARTTFDMTAVRSRHVFGWSKPIGLGEAAGDPYIVKGADVASIAGPLLPVRRVAVTFRTPAKLKREQSYRTDIPFALLVLSIVRRLRSLLQHHHGERPDEGEIERLLALAGGIETVGSDLKWVSNERYSTRQRQRVNIGGVTGRVVYEGDLSPFVPLLLLGTYTHAGKQAAFGLGSYALDFGAGDVPG